MHCPKYRGRSSASSARLSARAIEIRGDRSRGEACTFPSITDRRCDAVMSRVWPALLLAAIVLLVWSALPTVIAIPQFLLPRPLATWKVVMNDRVDLAAHAATTFWEALLGLVLAASAGIVLGSLFAMFNLLERMLLPFAIASQAVPIVAIAPVLVLWLGSGLQSKIAMAALICFFPMVVSTSK